jgi:hypothetical protein
MIKELRKHTGCSWSVAHRTFGGVTAYRTEYCDTRYTLLMSGYVPDPEALGSNEYLQRWELCEHGPKYGRTGTEPIIRRYPLPFGNIAEAVRDILQANKPKGVK